MKKAIKKTPAKRQSKAAKPRKPKSLPVDPVVVWQPEEEKDWLDHLLDRVERTWKMVFRGK
jgi:hypothetical protein